MGNEEIDYFPGNVPDFVQIFDPTLIRETEEPNWAIRKILESKKFNSFDEVQVYLNKLIQIGRQPKFKTETPMEKAQALVFKAIREKKKTKKSAIARWALQIFSDCADAYVLLAENEAADAAAARELYQKGMEAGERALGEQFFRDEIGRFWALIETRGYMRARAGLAICLWSLGDRKTAVSHLQDMLRVNPNDNQGLRSYLVCYLTELGMDQQVEGLLEKYEKDKSAFFQYSKTLLSFRRSGDVTRSRKYLDKAVRGNPFVPFLLTGKWKIPEALPSYIGYGDESEAEAYVFIAHCSWKDTPGVMEWIGECVEFLDEDSVRINPNKLG